MTWYTACPNCGGLGCVVHPVPSRWSFYCPSCGCSLSSDSYPEFIATLEAS